jgi:4-hydroxy-tetrahydrodipicolinate reductase
VQQEKWEPESFPLQKAARNSISLAKSSTEFNIVGALEHKNHNRAGTDVGEVIGTGKMNVLLSDTIESIKEKADVLIDFSAPEASLEISGVAAERNIAMVIGTTGFKKDDIAEIQSRCKNVACVLAPNMSVGINLLLKTLKDIANVLGDDYDVEVIEAHHRLKKDAPSGTALRIAHVLAEALNRNLEETAVYTRKGIIGKRTTKEIGIQTIRAGDIVGEHTVLFGGLGERIEVTHRASSRDTFARGALKAALWVSKQPPGFYDMQDVLGLV